MDYKLFVNCFFIGLSASCAIGPIFVLTFNRGALYGFWKGFATALGSSSVDGLYFSLGLLGAFTLLENSKNAIMLMDGIGGIIVMFLGINMLKNITIHLEDAMPRDENFFLSAIKAFILTILNPFVALYFMFMSVQILPENVVTLPLPQIVGTSIMVCIGSLSMLSGVAFVASLVGNTIKRKNLVIIEYITGFLFIGAGLYFLGDFFVQLFKK